MMTKFWNVLVLDKDHSEGQVFCSIIHDLFKKTYLQSDYDLTEIEEGPPKIIFINLSIRQRNEQFKQLSTILQGGSSLIFGYNDINEPELLTHALESGIHEVIHKPYNVDYIAGQINFHLLDERMNQNKKLEALIKPFPVSLRFSLELFSVEENGLTFKSRSYLSNGTLLRLSHPIIQEIFEVDTFEFIVTRNWMEGNWREFQIFCEPGIINEKVSASLRRFILKKL